MHEKVLKVVAGVALAGCMLVPLAACSNTSDNSEKVKQLEQQIQDLQSEIDSLKNNNSLTGCPKFEYDIGETISYYVNDTKIFDFKVTEFYFSSAELDVMCYSVDFAPTISYENELKDIFTASIYDTVNKTVKPESTWGGTKENGRMLFSTKVANKVTITLYFFDTPFACFTATPTKA